jgi:hypothetical protein
MILDALVQHLTENVNTGIAPGDVEYIEIVKKGLIQQNPIKNKILAVEGGDHEDPNYKDGIVTLQDLPNIGINWESVPREIGGGQLWFRRGIVDVKFFFIREKLTEDQAHDSAYNMLSRTMSLIDTVDLNGIQDTYGERAQQIYCYANTFFESGGPPKSFEFRGKIFWICLTERP